MRLVRGSIDDVDRDRAVTAALADAAAGADAPVLRVWTPPRQVAFGRRDTAAEGYDRARRIAVEHGYEPIERDVGGSAVAYTGHTVSFAYAVPTRTARNGIDRRYRRATTALLRALRGVGARVSRGEPDRSFCPGDHSVRASNAGRGKIAGIAQRVRRESALVGGCVVVRSADSDAIGDVLSPVYAALDLPFDSDAVGSVAAAGGPDATAPVVDALETAFRSDRSATVVSAPEFRPADAS